ncbi:Sphingolipid C4-hydroxylase sur2 [Marasmius crinis-equi]|uniref:Sphingolipid C4-hydroxylase sur2 n=1 Tax=Marasmius crinis-equi TaxID=585013 RepID=A0ABR3FUZ3_9AGAR
MAAPNATSCWRDVCFTSSDVPFYFSPKRQLVEGISDPILALAAPLISYWVLSLFFHFLDTQGKEWKWLEAYRIHESEDVKKRNLVSVGEVVWAVVWQQVLQTALGYVALEEHGADVWHMGKMQGWAKLLSPVVLRLVDPKHQARVLHDLAYFVYWWGVPTVQLFAAMFVIDTWQYFLHRFMHMNKFFYKHLHSVHHRLYVPYAFGALYNHPIEGFILDSVGSVLAEMITGMTTRQTLVLFGLASAKTVDDHCGYRFPLDPFQIVTGNNADYHDIHHQIIGIKSNFAQPFFIHWDVVLGTRMTRQEFEARKAKGRKAQ